VIIMVRMVMVSYRDGRGGTSILELHLEPFPLEQRQAPSALLAFPVDVLSAHPAPEEVIVRERLPRFVDLRRAAEGDGVEVAEDAEVDLAGQEGEGVDADDLVQRVGQVRQLRAAISANPTYPGFEGVRACGQPAIRPRGHLQATHGQNALQDQLPPCMRGI
jgi:hypothetical protein